MVILFGPSVRGKFIEKLPSVLAETTISSVSLEIKTTVFGEAFPVIKYGESKIIKLSSGFVTSKISIDGAVVTGPRNEYLLDFTY